MTSYLYQPSIRIFDYAQFAKPLAQAIRENAQALAEQHGLTIEYIRKKNFRGSRLMGRASRFVGGQ